MKAKGEFERILDEVLAREAGAQSRAGAGEASHDNIRRTEEFLKNYYFQFGPFKSAVFGQNAYAKNAKIRATGTAGGERAHEEKIKLTFGFESFGAEVHRDVSGTKSQGQSFGGPKASDEPKTGAGQSCHERKKETPKQKRKFTFDQLKAIRVFVNFGEKQIDEFSTDEEIKKAYRRLAKKFHPDAGARNDDHFKTISAAYDKLIS